MSPHPLPPELQAYKRRLYWMIALSSGIDTLIFLAETPLILPFFGSSLIVDELVEYFISNLLARNKMRIKRRYRIVGILPIPGVTGLSIQCLLELRRLRRHPEEVLARLQALASPAQPA
ncbi:MAG: hypothetical protein NW241_18135 [Bacteroidia bacterium]|nr:hypothetical protein [Bacteroidia bacterium]